MKRKNNQPKYSADCFLDSDNLNFFYIINVLLFHLFNLKRHVGKSVVIVYALCGEAVDAVTGILHAFSDSTVKIRRARALPLFRGQYRLRLCR